MKLHSFCLKITVLIPLLCFLLSPYAFSAQQSANQNKEIPKGSGITDMQPPSPPGNLSAANRTHTTILLTWSIPNDNVGVKGYQVYRNGKKIITTSKNAYTCRDLIPGQQYLFSLKAYDAAGNISEYSNTIDVSTIEDTQPPTIPGTPVAISVAYTSITLSWKPSSDNTGVKRYEVYLCGKKKASTSATTYVCKGLSPGKTYSFTIKAFDAAGNCSSCSGTLYADTTKDSVPPSTPQDLKAASIRETEISLVWSPSSDNVKVKKYEIYCDGKKVGSTSKTAYTCKKLVPGKTSGYTIRALDTSCLQSAQSSKLTLTTLKDQKAPTTPEGLKIRSVNKSMLSLSWNSSSDNTKVKGYKIYCNGFLIATTTRTTRSLKKPSGLGIGVYWVRAYDESENISEKSNVVTAITAS